MEREEKREEREMPATLEEKGCYRIFPPKRKWGKGVELIGWVARNWGILLAGDTSPHLRANQKMQLSLLSLLLLLLYSLPWRV